jgi:tRNA U34 5-carboxymethylaminomethyl modifying enzyme MnmG/GidA
MRLNHDELGIIDITVNKLGVNQDAIAINIGTHSLDGKNFFQTNSKDLFSHLTNSGLNVSDLKVETPSQTAKNDFDFGGQSGRGGFGQEKQFGSEQNQRRHDSERRQDLWSLLKDKEAA